MNKSLKTVIIGAVVFALIKSGLNEYNKKKIVDDEDQARKNAQAISKFRYSSYDFNIDSLKMALLKDRSVKIDSIIYSKEDSSFLILLNPDFDMTDSIKRHNIYTKYITDHMMEYATNISYISVVKTFTLEDLKTPKFKPTIYWTVISPNSRLYQ